jgi:hypothetical protein
MVLQTYQLLVLMLLVCTILVYGSEYGKGKRYLEADGATATDSRGANQPQFKAYSNKPIIMKDYYEVSGSDTSRIGWVEITSEEGQSGYLWYLKAEADTRARFNDYIEMAMLESEKADESTDDVAAFVSLQQLQIQLVQKVYSLLLNQEVILLLV